MFEAGRGEFQPGPEPAAADPKTGEARTPTSIERL
jgi:hypothetical protein